ncbi:molybdopterin-dependent oxidoreductase [Rhodoferax sp.]|uniref:molybdopterin-dependent oxidoreductase n=1 Tax=Rhodoferax sp. TaxID=50421 RepID=UPI0025DA9EDB|nr:molybdopterin-dependent oxidoreductase [Rhodoferax sp.]
MPISLRTARIGLASAILWSAAVLALDKPTGNVVLTISGTVAQANSGANAVFDMKMLEKLPQKTFTVQTPWYPKPVTFTGPLLRDVLAAAGAKGNKIVATALNDYKTDIPFDDAIKFDPIVAHLLDNKPMSIREKGPLFIVYPFDASPELRAEVYYNRSAWQLNSLKVQ